LLLGLTCLAPLQAQTGTKGPSDSNAPAASRTSNGQAPDEVTRKLTDLVHAGKYAEAEKLTTGLLAAYPTDQRLIKAEALIAKRLAPAGQTLESPIQPVQPTANNSADQLTGMEKVDYSALIVLARQGMQATDLAEQQTLLQQFMDQSIVFLQKHPDQMLLWQLRAATAISLNDPVAGYEAGQKLITAGAADSGDPNLLQLLGQLKNKRWLDKAEAERLAKYGWLLGTWSLSCAETDENGEVHQRCDAGDIKFSKHNASDSVAEGYRINDAGVKSNQSAFRVTILDSGQIRCEQNNGTSKWAPVLSCDSADNNRSLTIKSAAYKQNGYVWISSLHKK
jgi:hypothetical protein